MRFNEKERRRALVSKRLIDIALSIPLLVLFIPLITIACLGVYLTSGWPIIIAQKRVGQHGKLFRMYKIRTMVKNAHLIKAAIYSKHPRDHEGKMTDDPRITAIGKFLRCSSIDELPQIINVILGNMSLVGPRPQEVEDLEAMPKYHCYLKHFRPGMTGLAQIYGRDKLSHAQMDELNGWYAKIWHLKLDLTIIVKTVFVVFKQDDAF